MEPFFVNANTLSIINSRQKVSTIYIVCGGDSIVNGIFSPIIYIFFSFLVGPFANLMGCVFRIADLIFLNVLALLYYYYALSPFFFF